MSQSITQPNVWAEHAPPCIDSHAIARMVQQVCTARLHQLDPMAVPHEPAHLYTKMMEARTSRTLRTEAQLISMALFDETSEVSIAPHVGAAWLSKTQQIFRNARAICQGAHLRLLKAFHKKVFDLATQSMPADSGLRTVNIQELLHAD